MDNQQPFNTGDFASNSLINKIPRHDKDINWIKKKISELEGRVGDNESFAKAFVSAQKNDKSIDEALNAVIDEHDNHKIKVNALALGKWVLAATVGAIITWLVTQGFVIPQYNLRIDELQNQVEDLKV